MSSRVCLTVALSGGAAGAVLWACCLALLAPRTEPHPVPGLAVAGNNDYWVRDLRWAAVCAVAVAVVVSARGGPLRSVLAALGTVAWLAADVLLDRHDVAGPAAAAALSAAGVTLSVGACVAARLVLRPAGAGAGRWAVRAGVAVAAAMSMVAVLTESPSDREAALDPVSWAVAVVLALVAVAGAHSVSSVPAGRWRWLAPGLVAGAVVGPALVRAVPVDERLWPGLGWGVALLTAVAVVSWGWTWSGGGGPAGRVRRVALLAVLSLVVVAVASAFGIYGELAAQLGRRCTAWAGNAAVNGADTDLIASVLGVGDGLAVVLLWACLAVPKRDVPTRDGGRRSSPSTPTGVGDDGLRCDHVAEPGA